MWRACCSVGVLSGSAVVRRDQRFTYGFGRSTQLASLINAVLILMAAGGVFVEGLQRLIEPGDPPQPAGGLGSGGGGGGGEPGLGAPVWRSPPARPQSPLRCGAPANRRGRVGCVLLECPGGGVVTGWNRLDGISGDGRGPGRGLERLAAAARSAIVALDAVPPGLDLEDVSQALRGLPGVVEVHHLHVWAMSTSQNALTAHLSRRLGSTDDMHLLHQAKQRLAELGIAHSTLQLEPFQDQTLPPDP
jgi:cobalt-zinc-cadmium efflux system protein